MMSFVMRDGVMGTSQDNYLDGKPCAMKVARTVWTGGKAGDSIKCLPISIFKRAVYGMIDFYMEEEADLRSTCS